MSLRQLLVPLLDHIDPLLGPAALDFRPTTVTIISRTWPTLKIGNGSPTDSPLELPDYVKVRQVSAREIASSGGRFEEGAVRIGPVRPSYNDPAFGVGGFTEAQLDPAATLSAALRGTQAFQVIYRLAQEDTTATGLAGDYRLAEMRRDRVLRFMLVVNRIRTTA